MFNLKKRNKNIGIIPIYSYKAMSDEDWQKGAKEQQKKHPKEYEKLYKEYPELSPEVRKIGLYEFKILIDISKTLTKKKRYQIYKECRKLKFSSNVLKLIRRVNSVIDKEIKENAIHK